MSYEISTTETIRSKVVVGSPVELSQILDLIEGVGPSHFNKSDAKALLKQTGSYSFSNGNKMLTIRYISDFKGQ